MAKKKLLFIFVLLVCFLLVEAIFRLTGTIAGYKWNLPFAHTDSLILFNDWITDSNGIFKLNTEVNAKIRNCRMSFEEVWESDTIDLAVKYLIVSHQKLKPKKKSFSFARAADIVEAFSLNSRLPFTEMVSHFGGGHNLTDSIDFYYSRFIECPVNEDGFYSIPFRNFETKKKKILLVGDSFTFGFSAVPSYNSFACSLAEKGYAVFNGGIPGADPAQYCAVVAAYIHKIQPDVVIICSNISTDVMQNNRILYRDSFLYFSTNTTWIKAYFNNHYFQSADTAYRFFESQAKVPAKQNSIIASIIRHSAIATKLYLLGVKNFTGNATGENVSYYGDSLSYSEYYFKKIDSICRSNNTGCKFILLPDRDDLSMDNLRKPPYIFRTIQAIPVSGLTTGDYSKGNDNHFNNSGHYKASVFIDSILKIDSY